MNAEGRFFNQLNPMGRSRGVTVAMLLASATISIVVGSTPASGAVSCMAGEVVYMVNPVVTVVEGPGDVAEQQEAWSAQGDSVLSAPLNVGIGERTLDLERLP